MGDLTPFFTHDALNRPIRTTDPAGGETGTRYDGLSRLSEVQDPRGLATRYLTDGLGNRTQETSPDRGVTQMSYDAAGNLRTRTDARGVTASYAYDALNRLFRAGRVMPTRPKRLELSRARKSPPLTPITNHSTAGGATPEYRLLGYDPAGRVTGYFHTATAALNQGFAYDEQGHLGEVGGNQILNWHRQVPSFSGKFAPRAAWAVAGFLAAVPNYPQGGRRARAD